MRLNQLRLGAIIPCYKMTYFLPAVLESLKDLEQVVVLNGDKPWESNERVEDNTKEIAEMFDNVTVVKGSWSDEAVQRTVGVRILKDMDYVFTLDSDEILLPGDQRRMVEFAEDHKDCNAFASSIVTYKPNLSNRAIYDEGHTPIVMVRPVPNFSFSVIRCVNGHYLPNYSVNLHHLKFLQPEDQLSWRLNSKYSHEKREVKGTVPTEKSLELEEFLTGLGYTELKEQVKEVSFA